MEPDESDGRRARGTASVQLAISRAQDRAAKSRYETDEARSERDRVLAQLEASRAAETRQADKISRLEEDLEAA